MGKHLRTCSEKPPLRPLSQAQQRIDDGASAVAEKRHRPDRPGDVIPAVTDDHWSARAACLTVDPDELFVTGAAQHISKIVCVGCAVSTECLAYALDQRIEHGVWGGMTERERRGLLRRRPTVTSWRRLLETARLEHQRRAGAAALSASAGIS